MDLKRIKLEGYNIGTIELFGLTFVLLFLLAMCSSGVVSGWLQRGFVIFIPVLICATGGLGFVCYLRFREMFSAKFGIERFLKRFVEMNKLVEYENVSKVEDGKTVIVKKISYCPDIYYGVDNETVIVRFILDGSKKSMNYVDYKEQLEHLLSFRCTGVDVERGCVTYSFTSESVKQFNDTDLKMASVFQDGYKIPVNESIVWDIVKDAHGLIIGKPGSGKTYFLSYIVLSLLRFGAEVNILDPKRADLSYLKKFLPDNVHFETNYILKTLRLAVEEMNSRYEFMINHEDYSFGKCFDYYGLKPYFILFDELSAFTAGLSKKQKEECESYLTEIVLKGRQAGVDVVFIMQRPDSDYIKVAIRDQLGFRVSLGNVTSTAYKMVFGDEYKDLNLSLSEKGAGFCFLENYMKVPSEFIAPYMDIDFVEEFKNLVNKN